MLINDVLAKVDVWSLILLKFARNKILGGYLVTIDIEKPTIFENHLSLYNLTPQAAFFIFTEKDLDATILQNHLLLVFKIYLYKSRSYGFVCLKPLLLEIKKINCLEKKIAETNANKHKSYLLKWNKIDNQLTTYN